MAVIQEISNSLQTPAPQRFTADNILPLILKGTEKCNALSSVVEARIRAKEDKGSVREKAARRTRLTSQEVGVVES